MCFQVAWNLSAKQINGTMCKYSTSPGAQLAEDLTLGGPALSPAFTFVARLVARYYDCFPSPPVIHHFTQTVPNNFNIHVCFIDGDNTAKLNKSKIDCKANLASMPYILHK